MANKRRRRPLIAYKATILCIAAQLGDANSIERFIDTEFSGSYHADGNIFEVRAKGKHVSVVRLDINMDAALGTVEVWSRPGEMVPNDDGGWFLLKSFDITGQGKGNITSLPAFEFPIVIPPGSKQSFYVTTTSENADLWYGVGELLGSAYASNKNLEVLDAYAVGYYFKGIAQPRRWNGIIHYSVPDDGSTYSPTEVPTSAQPSDTMTAYPSPKPTKYPILSPTQSPTNKSTTSAPISPPTKQPTNPPIAPNEIPINVPINVPTLSPSVVILNHPSNTEIPSTFGNSTLAPTLRPDSSVGIKHGSSGYILITATFLMAVGFALLS